MISKPIMINTLHICISGTKNRDWNAD